jgi:dihydroxyacetone kinase-like protein
MKRLIDDPRTLVPQMIDGYLRAFGRSYQKVDRYNGIVRRCREERVSIVTGGGSGGEPWCIGMAGEGLADGVAVGNIFASPPATAVAAVARAVYNREGVLLIAGNHSGDVMNLNWRKNCSSSTPAYGATPYLSPTTWPPRPFDPSGAASPGCAR